MKNVLFIAGSDTDVGKTFLTSALVAYWAIYLKNKSLGLMKLLQTGTGDQEYYQQLWGATENLKIVTPLVFETPVAPPIAAEREGKSLDLAKVWQEFSKLQQEQDFVLVEGLGGLGSPVTHELTVGDLAGEWRLETVLVIPIKLGAISQAVANVALARQCKVKLRGIVLNCSQPVTAEEIDLWSPRNLIQSLTQVPVLGILPYFNDLMNRETLAQGLGELARLLS
jgi:dethiobiotin synthetase